MTQIILSIFFLTYTYPVLAQVSLQSLTVNDTKRNYRLFLPTEYLQDKKYSLLLNFHGTGSTPESQNQLSEFELIAAQQLFIVVSPSAKYQREKGGLFTWNVDEDPNGVDDVEFIKVLLKNLQLHFPIDNKRIYAAGMSGGGRMVSRLGCDLSGVIAAIAPVTGLRFPENCTATMSMPVIAFHGKLDTINHYSLQSTSPSYWREGVERALSKWVKHNQCLNINTSEIKVTEQVTKLHYKGCKNNSDVVFYRSSNAGHTWPGSPLAKAFEDYGLGVTNTDLPASKIIWEFFLNHPKL
jgi:polyhydroxybutyrate depolymerase